MGTRADDAAPGPVLRPAEAVGCTRGRYLLGLYRLSLVTEGPISTGRLGECLGVARSSSAGMAAKLAEAGLVDRDKHEGVELTDRGAAVGEALAWRCCVAANFCREHLDWAVDQRTAYRFGYALSPEATLALADRTAVPCTGRCRPAGCSFEECQRRADADA